MHPDGYDGAGFFQKLANLYELQKFIDDLIITISSRKIPFNMSEDLIKAVHRIAMKNLLPDAGQYRKGDVEIKNSPHVPPSWMDVPAQMGTFVQYLQQNWDQKDLVHLSSFVMWRLNWIHPFSNGNGRSTRGLAYLVLCAKHGELLPAKSSVAQQIAENKQPYYDALKKADAIFAATHNIDLALQDMVALISFLLKEQLRANL